MSRPIALGYPQRVAMSATAIAPAAMPEAASRTGYFSTIAGVIEPPPEWSRSRSPSYPSVRSCASSRLTYPLTRGASTALATVVEARSYSKISGRISLEVETVTSGSSASSSARTRCSCALLT